MIELPARPGFSPDQTKFLVPGARIPTPLAHSSEPLYRGSLFPLTRGKGLGSGEHLLCVIYEEDSPPPRHFPPISCFLRGEKVEFHRHDPVFGVDFLCVQILHNFKPLFPLLQTGRGSPFGCRRTG